MLEQLSLKDAKEATTPGTSEEGRTSEDHQQLLQDLEVSKYRALVARCNYISPDRPDIAFAAKELARAMAAPTRGDWQRLKRLGRYLEGVPRVQQMYEWQGKPTKMKTYSDADWAGCRATRKSTT